MREVYVYFSPTADIKMLTLSPLATIRHLKALCEEECGIPSDVFVLTHKSTAPEDNAKLLDLSASEYMLFDLLVQPVWDKFVHSCIRGEPHNVMARIRIKMNQLSSESRTFVAAFVASHRGNRELFHLLVDSCKKEVLQETVRSTGRSLLHAAVMGGNIGCVISLFTNGAWKLLHQGDELRESPLDMARRLRKEESLLEILKKYNDICISGHWYENEVTSSGSGDESCHSETHEISPTSGAADAGKTSFDVGGHATSPSGSRRLLHRGAVPCPNRIPTPPTGQRNGAYRTHPRGTETVGVKTAWGDTSRLPSVTTVRGPGQHRALKDDMGLCRHSSHEDTARDRSASAPLEPLLLIRRRRAGSVEEDQRCDVIPQGSSLHSSDISSSAPNSPVFLKKQHSLPLSPLARRKSPFPVRRVADNPESHRCDVRQLPVSHACHKSPREDLPWNAWKTVRASEAVGESRDSEPNCEHQNTSRRQKSFETWLAAKEDEQARRHMEAQNESKRVTEQKALEEAHRRARTKTFDEWLKDKEAMIAKSKDGEEHLAEVTEAEREARRANVSLRYQQWMKRKDEEAIAREETIMEEERRKFEELKKKKEEHGARLLKKKLVGTRSLPV